jgi:hypothetical protein
MDVCFKSPVSCVAFATDGSVQNTLTSGLSSPQGVAADRDGNAYIADAGNAEIYEYGPYLKTLIKTYTDPGEVPVDVDSAAQLLVVSKSSTPSVSVYAGGSTSPTAVLTDPKAPNPTGIGIALDGHDDCFWSPGQTYEYKIDEFAGCSGEPTEVRGTKRVLDGLAFDGANNLYHVERRGDIKRGGYGADGEIFQCVGTTQCVARYKGRAGTINFDQRWKFLWTVTPRVPNKVRLRYSNGRRPRSRSWLDIEVAPQVGYSLLDHRAYLRVNALPLLVGQAAIDQIAGC